MDYLALLMITCTLSGIAHGAIEESTWRKDFDIECPDGKTVRMIRGMFDAYRGVKDRLYVVLCEKHIDITSDCYWTGFRNEYGGPMSFFCHPDHVIRSIASIYDKNAADRRFNFECCKQANKMQGHCHFTKKYINKYGRIMRYTAPENKVIRGFKSIYNAWMGDRVWKVYVCEQMEE